MSDILDNARIFRKLIEEKIIQFVPEKEADKFADFHPKWSGDGIYYRRGLRVRNEDGVLYSVLQSHISQPTLTPSGSPSLFAKVLTSEDGTILPWEQPDSTNGYSKDDKVTHNGQTWISLVNNNVWEPGVVGTESVWGLAD